jgi:hypothetical protein
MYLETLHVQGVQQSETVYPRIKLYTASYLNMLVEADKATSSSRPGKVSWGSTIVSSQIHILFLLNRCKLHVKLNLIYLAGPECNTHG